MYKLYIYISQSEVRRRWDEVSQFKQRAGKEADPPSCAFCSVEPSVGWPVLSHRGEGHLLYWVPRSEGYSLWKRALVPPGTVFNLGGLNASSGSTHVDIKLTVTGFRVRTTTWTTKTKSLNKGSKGLKRQHKLYLKPAMVQIFGWLYVQNGLYFLERQQVIILRVPWGDKS